MCKKFWSVWTARMEIRKYCSAGHVLIAFAVALFVMTALRSSAEAVMIDRVVATVNKEVITLSDYRRFLLQTGSSSSPETIDEDLLRKLIDEKLILFEAQKEGIETSPAEIADIIREFQKSNNLSDEEIRARLAAQAMTFAEYETLIRQHTIAFKLVDREINRKIIVTDREIDEYYETHKKQFAEKPERMLVKAILLRCSDHPTLTEVTDLKMKTLKILSELRKGEPFEKMVSRYSDEPLRAQDGLLGEIEPGTLIAELNLVTASLQEGEISRPVWTKDGVYILKMVKRIDASYSPFDEARSRIAGTLYQQKRENAYQAWLKSLWDKSSVIIK